MNSTKIMSHHDSHLYSPNMKTADTTFILQDF